MPFLCSKNDLDNSTCFESEVDSFKESTIVKK